MDGAGRAKKRRDALAGLTLGAVLGDEKEQLTIPTRPQVNRTLLDIIREEEPNSRAYKNLVHHHHNKKSWKSFKDRLRLKKAGAIWTSSVPTSDVPLHRSSIASSTLSSGGGGFGQLSRRNSVRVDVEEDEEVDDEAEMETGQGQVHLLNRSLSRVVSLQTDLTQEDTLHIEQVPVSDVPIMNCRSSMLRRNSSRIPSAGQPDEGVSNMRLSEALAAEREQIQRVVSSTEAAGRARAVERDNKESGVEMGHNDEETVDVEGGGDVDRDEKQPEVRMSLMDLLGETDGQMGWSPYSGDEDEEDEEYDEEEDEEGSNLVERNCCVCMVRHKGSAFIPCGHTFCRLCSRELWVSRGNCPLCNGFILEILDIF